MGKKDKALPLFCQKDENIIGLEFKKMKHLRKAIHVLQLLQETLF